MMRSTPKPLRASSPADVAAIQALFDADPAFWRLSEGLPARPDEAARLFSEPPPGGSTRVFFDGVTVLECLEGHPTPTTWYLGLIFIAPTARNAGRGTAAIAELSAHALARGGTHLRLAVFSEHVAARRFYDRLGFEHIARRPRTTWCGAAHEYDVLELALTSRTRAHRVARTTS